MRYVVTFSIAQSIYTGIIVSNPENSTMKNGHTLYTCNVACSEGSLVTWIANGKPLQYLPQIKFSARNNYLTVCNSEGTNNVDPVYTEYLEIEVAKAFSIQLQCVSIFHCNTGSEDCTSSTCFSRVAHLISMFPTSFSLDMISGELHDEFVCLISHADQQPGVHIGLFSVNSTTQVFSTEETSKK